MIDYRFSVAICVYGKDNPVYFDEALKSIYNQTLKPDEVVLTVDGPVPESIEKVISNYASQYETKIVRLKENMGHGIARRASLSQCKYNLVAIADADDINRVDRFEKQISAFVDNPSLTAVSSYTPHFVDSIDNIISYETLPTNNDDIRKEMKIRCPLTQAAIMFKKDEVEDAGGYIDWYHAEDYYLWIRLYQNDAVFMNIPENLVYVRSDNSQMKRRGGFKYFISLRKLYKYMLDNRIIDKKQYLINVCTRFVVQIIMPPKIRGYIRRIYMGNKQS